MNENLPYGAVDERSQQLLRILVDRYLRDGSPVGSRTLSRESGLELSPATIRNVMADLEDAGLVSSPHTSAGRIPTEHGLRFFVDSLMTVDALDSGEINQYKEELGAVGDANQLVAKATNLLSSVTQLAGIVTLPSQEYKKLKHIELMPLSQNRVLAILVINDEEVQNNILVTDRQYSAAELQQFSNYLNSLFSGREIEEVRTAIINEMQNARTRMDEMMVSAIQMANEAFRQSGDEDYVLAGQTNLMDVAELADTRTLRQIFDTFNEKRQMLHLLDGALKGEGIQIFIGEESGYEGLDNCSVVASPYQVDNKVVGVLGVIGPTRMAYNRVVPLVDVTARLLGSALANR